MNGKALHGDVGAEYTHSGLQYPSALPDSADLVSAQPERTFERIFEMENANPDSDFCGVGGDSMAAVQLLVDIEDRLGVRPPETPLHDHSSIAGVITSHVRDQLNGTAVPFQHVSGPLC